MKSKTPDDLLNETRAWRVLNSLSTLALDDLLAVAGVASNTNREDRITIVIGLLKGHTP